MDQITNIAELEALVAQEVEDFVSPGFDGTMHYFANPVEHIYLVLHVPGKSTDPPGVVVMARILGDQVVIREDNTTRPLAETLLDFGVPASQIVRAYAGDPLPEWPGMPLEYP